MKRLTLNGTSLDISCVGFGTASLHRLFRDKDRQSLLGTALDAGITHFDTARMYGNGLAERHLGHFLKGRRSQVTIATKLGIPAVPALERWPALMYVQKGMGIITRHFIKPQNPIRARRFSLPAAEDSLHRSLRALKTDWLDVLFLHEPLVTETDDVIALSDWLLRQRREGYVRYLGLAGMVHDCLEIARRLEGLFDILQVEDSLEHREADKLSQHGWPMQITYGYLRRSQAVNGSPAAESIFAKALKRNNEGVILVSTRIPQRLQKLAHVVERAK